MLSVQGKLIEARANYNEALKRIENSPENIDLAVKINLHLSEIYRDMGDKDHGLKVLKKALQELPADCDPTLKLELMD